MRRVSFQGTSHAVIPTDFAALVLGFAPDGTLRGGVRRGVGAVDLQINRSTSSGRVASGRRSFIGGGNNNAASADDTAVLGGTGNIASDLAAAVVGGTGNTANGAYGVALGGRNNTAAGDAIAGGFGSTATGPVTVALGLANNANSEGSVALGSRSFAYTRGMFATASGNFANTNGTAQKITICATRRTTDATPSTLHPSGENFSTGILLTIPSGKVISFFINIVGIKSDGSAVARYLRTCIIKNVAGTTSLIGSVEIIGTDYEDNPLTNVAITANDTSDCLDITVTGIASETWRWIATVEGAEVAYGT